jgi:hypothetical protein
MAKSPTWQRKEGKNPKGGLNAKGRASYNKANPGKPDLKPRSQRAALGKIVLCPYDRYEKEVDFFQDS